MTDDLMKGDRVIVEIPGKSPFTGVIFGEGRNGTWWNVIKDGTTRPRGFHKTFCRSEFSTMTNESQR